MEKDWKLKLKYGKLKTSYSHFTVLANGIAGDLKEGFLCRQGKAWMGMKTWATSSEEAADMIRIIGQQIGFEVTGRIEIFETEPEEPPIDKPYGYGINFSPYDKE